MLQEEEYIWEIPYQIKKGFSFKVNHCVWRILYQIVSYSVLVSDTTFWPKKVVLFPEITRPHSHVSEYIFLISKKQSNKLEKAILKKAKETEEEKF